MHRRTLPRRVGSIHRPQFTLRTPVGQQTIQAPLSVLSMCFSACLIFYFSVSLLLLIVSLSLSVSLCVSLSPFLSRCLSSTIDKEPFYWKVLRCPQKPCLPCTDALDYLYSCPGCLQSETVCLSTAYAE